MNHLFSSFFFFFEQKLKKHLHKEVELHQLTQDGHKNKGRQFYHPAKILTLV